MTAAAPAIVRHHRDTPLRRISVSTRADAMTRDLSAALLLCSGTAIASADAASCDSAAWRGHSWHVERCASTDRRSSTSSAPRAHASSSSRTDSQSSRI
jgi:hypothetical protein